MTTIPITDETQGCIDEAVTFVFSELARALKVDDWSIEDGTETWDGDVVATLNGILRRAKVIDEQTGCLTAALAGGSGDDRFLKFKTDIYSMLWPVSATHDGIDKVKANAHDAIRAYVYHELKLPVPPVAAPDAEKGK